MLCILFLYTPQFFHKALKIMVVVVVENVRELGYSFTFCYELLPFQALVDTAMRGNTNTRVLLLLQSIWSWVSTVRGACRRFLCSRFHIQVVVEWKLAANHTLDTPGKLSVDRRRERDQSCCPSLVLNIRRLSVEKSGNKAPVMHSFASCVIITSSICRSK